METKPFDKIDAQIEVAKARIRRLRLEKKLNELRETEAALLGLAEEKRRSAKGGVVNRRAGSVPLSS